MKYVIGSIALLFSLSLFSQTPSVDKLITLISKADTVHFIADNSGCFNSYILNVKFCKQKSGQRKVILKTKKGVEEHYLSAKNYQKFIDNYKASTNYFINNDKTTCTSITAFDLYSYAKKGSINGSKFKNLNCNADYNPEMFLQNLFRANESHKK
jgi:hypothetical protein